MGARAAAAARLPVPLAAEPPGAANTTAPDDAVRIGGLSFARRRPLDGPLGSELLARSGGRRRPGEQLARWSRERPEAVQAVHADYLGAGAQWITTNTFLAHAEPDAADLVARSVVLARGVAVGQGVPVAVSLAPGAPSARCAPGAYTALGRAAADAGASLLLLETFTDLGELAGIVQALASSGSLPVAALLVFDAAGRVLRSGETGADAARALRDVGAQAIGANCQPPDVLPRALEAMARVLPGGFPLVARPSAGIPAAIGETWQYPWAPEPWARATADLQACCGAALLGGCCGAGPAHIAFLAAALAAAAAAAS